eukprot:112825_1
MLSNSQKVDLLRGKIRWSNNSPEIPWSITTTPNVNHLYSASETYRDLKYNQHIVAAIFDSLNEYEAMMGNLNEQDTILNATRCDVDAPPIGTIHKLSDELYAIAYDTCQFNWDNRPLNILYSDLFGGDDPLLSMRECKDTWECKDSHHNHDLASKFADRIQTVSIFLVLVCFAMCQRKINFSTLNQ